MTTATKAIHAVAILAMLVAVVFGAQPWWVLVAPIAVLLAVPLAVCAVNVIAISIAIVLWVVSTIAIEVKSR